MSSIQALTIVLIRLIALTFVFSPLANIVGTFPGYTLPSSDSEEANTYYVYALSMLIAYIGVGVLLWWFSKPISKLIVKGLDHEDPSIDISPPQLVAVGTFLIGIYLVLSVAPSVALDTAQYVSFLNQYPNSSSFWSSRWSEIIADWILLGLGLFLIFRLSGIVNVFNWARQDSLSGKRPAQEND